MYSHICKTCKKQFQRPIKNQIYCSRNCYIKTGSNNPKWRGGKVIIGGYYYIFIPSHPNATKDGYVCEHRLVMEKILKRYLKSGEVVHHLNHNTLDNRPLNLHLCPSTGKHFIKYHLDKRDKLGRFYKVH